MTGTLSSRINRAQLTTAGIGLIGLIVCSLSLFGNVHQFFTSYLFGFLFWLGLSLGCLAIAMINYLTGGRWGSVTRRFFEAGFMIIPFMAILFIPILCGLNKIYAWTQPALVAADKSLHNKAAYLNPTAFIARAVIYFIIWSILAFCLRQWSLQQDKTADVAPLRRMRTLSGPGIVLYALTVTFASIDWIMSLEVDWYSTMFPVIICIGQILTAYTFSTMTLAWFRKESPMREAATVTQFLQLGNFLLAFVMFWTYVMFGQFLINWSGNTPREILWYQHRIAGSWKILVGILLVFQFLVPFFVLLFRSAKQNVKPLVTLAAMVFIAQTLAVFWLITPAFYQTGIHVVWQDFAAFFGVGGVWLALFLALVKRHPLIPLNDPRIEVSLAV